MVISWQRLACDEGIVYEIQRERYSDRVKIWLSDAYLFTDMDFLNRPSIITAGDYILIAKPEGGEVVSHELISSSRIGVGKIGELMGALNKREMWTYVPPTEEERRARAQKSGR